MGVMAFLVPHFVSSTLARLSTIPIMRAGLKLFILETLSNDHSRNFKEAIRIVGFAPIESERLLVKIAEKVKRFDTDIRAADGSL
jgi:hypothetical protein